MALDTKRSVDAGEIARETREHVFVSWSAQGALSQVVIDNTQNRSDAYVKVVSVGDSEPRVVRNVFIQASDRFTVANLRAGTYEVRYQNLDSGRLLRSEVFALEESAIASGSRYSTVTLTLRTRADEAMNTFDLPKEQF